MMQPPTNNILSTVIRQSNSDGVPKFVDSPIASPRSELAIQTSDAKERVIG